MALTCSPWVPPGGCFHHHSSCSCSWGLQAPSPFSGFHFLPVSQAAGQGGMAQHSLQCWGICSMVAQGIPQPRRVVRASYLPTCICGAVLGVGGHQRSLHLGRQGWGGLLDLLVRPLWCVDPAVTQVLRSWSALLYVRLTYSTSNIEWTRFVSLVCSEWCLTQTRPNNNLLIIFYLMALLLLLCLK